MESVIDVRNKLHHYIDKAALNKLEAIYVLLKDEIDYQYSPGDIEALNERRQLHLDGKSRSFTADEVIKAARNRNL